MNKTVEATGKTIDEAIENALLLLGGVDRDSVSVEVLEKHKPGFLGFGGTLAKVKVSHEISQTGTAETFLSELLEKMGAIATINVKESTEDNLDMEVVGENMGIVIGRRGDTLDAIQHITNLVVNRGEEKHVRVTIDTENYRKKREETLEKLARRVASRVVKLRKNQILEPMNAYERHVIHAALQDWRDVTTASTGVEPNRRIVINYAPAQRRGGNYNPGRNAGSNNFRNNQQTETRSEQ